MRLSELSNLKATMLGVLALRHGACEY